MLETGAINSNIVYTTGAINSNIVYTGNWYYK